MSAALTERSGFEEFASPFDRQGGSLVELVMVERARAVAGALLQHAAPLPRRAELFAYLAGWLGGDADAETCWDPAFSCAGGKIGVPDGGARDPVLLAVALRIAERGRAGAFAFASPDAPVRFGTAVMPCAERGRFRSDGELAWFELASGASEERFVFRRAAPGWVLVDGSADRVTVVGTMAFGSRDVVLADREEAVLSSWTATVPLWSSGREIVAARCARAVELIGRCAPPYAAWTERVIRTIVPRTTGNGTLFSGSASEHAGVVELAFDTATVSLAEALVHEATHQYLHLASCVAPVDDGTDPTLYYSPVKRTGRPIRAILVAYHAFANVVMFYRMCRAAGLDDGGYCARNETETVEQLNVLEAALHATRALTDVGHALWQPLAGRLRDG